MQSPVYLTAYPQKQNPSKKCITDIHEERLSITTLSARTLDFDYRICCQIVMHTDVYRCFWFLWAHHSFSPWFLVLLDYRFKNVKVRSSEISVESLLCPNAAVNYQAALFSASLQDSELKGNLLKRDCVYVGCEQLGKRACCCWVFAWHFYQKSSCSSDILLSCLWQSTSNRFD